MRYYYKDKNNNYYNLKAKGFQIPNEVIKQDEEGNEYTDIEYTLDPDYTEITEEEFNNATIVETPKLDVEKANLTSEIALLKVELASSDFKAIKYAEGLYSEEEYAPVKAQRQELRAKIRELEIKLNG